MHLYICFSSVSCLSVCPFSQSVCLTDCPSFCLSVRPSVSQFMIELNSVDFCRKHYLLMQKDDPSMANYGFLQNILMNFTRCSLLRWISVHSYCHSLHFCCLSSLYCRLTRLQDLLQKQFFACLSRIVVKKLLVR